MTLWTPSFENQVIVGIDPGIQNTGLARVFWNPTHHVTRIEHLTLDNETIERSSPCITLLTPRQGKLHNLYHAISAFVREPCATVVVIENPFFNPAAPSAYGSLKEIVGLIGGICLATPPVAFYAFSPMEVKETLGNSKVKGKLAMQQELSRRYFDRIFPLDPTEHAADAIAVALTWVNFHLGRITC